MSRDLGTVRISEQGKDQLVKLKRITGIRHWNVLCRWALCASLADDSPPLVRAFPNVSNVEMNWRTFAGPLDAEFVALAKMRMRKEQFWEGDLGALVAAHVHRGIGILAGGSMAGIRDLVPLAVSE